MAVVILTGPECPGKLRMSSNLLEGTKTQFGEESNSIEISEIVFTAKSHS